MKETLKYWLDKGYDEKDALDMVSKYHGYRNKSNKNYYLIRNHTSNEEDAIKMAKEYSNNLKVILYNKRMEKFGWDVEKYKEYIKKTSFLSKENLIKNKFDGDENAYNSYKKNSAKLTIGLNKNKPNSFEYYLNRGFDIETSKKMALEHTKSTSVRCVEHWLKLGFSLEESVLKVSEIQDNSSLKSMIKRFGVIEGKIKHELLCDSRKISSIWSKNYWIKNGLSEKDAEEVIRKLQSDNAKKSKRNKEYWIGLGLNEDDANTMSIWESKIRSVWCKEYWMDKGLSELESKNKVSEIQKEFSIRNLKNFEESGCVYRSNIELLVEDVLKSIGLNYIHTYKIYDRVENKFYFPDFYIPDLNLFIEIFGEYWHAKDSDDNFLIRGRKSIDIRNNDSNRIQRIKKITNCDVKILWYNDIIKNGVDKIIKETIKNYENKENK